MTFVLQTMAMNKRLIIDDNKCRLFMEQNAGWQNTIKAQLNEIPEMLTCTVNTPDEERVNNQDSELHKQLLLQQNKMRMLEKDIEMQQKRLAMDCDIKNLYDIDAYCTQDILRERIKIIEKAYIDLKCNFFNNLEIQS